MRLQRGKSRRRASISTILMRFLRPERWRLSNHATCTVDRLGLTLAKPVVQTVPRSTMAHQDRHNVGNRARESAASGVCRAVSVPSCTSLMALLLFGLGYSTFGHAAEPDVASLQRDVIALSELVQRLQARVDRLELQASSAGPSASDPARTEPAVTPQKSIQASAGIVS